jgi:hypothetical protein
MTPDRGGKIFVGKGCGEAKPDFVRRAKDLEFDYTPDQFPILFWDLFGQESSNPRHGVRDGAGSGLAHAQERRHHRQSCRVRRARRRNEKVKP